VRSAVTEHDDAPKKKEYPFYVDANTVRQLLPDLANLIQLEFVLPGGSFADTTTPISLTNACGLGSSCSGLFQISQPGRNIAGGSFGFNNFTFNTEVAYIATTPIPATLPLFISAVGGLGFLGYRRGANMI